MPRRSFAPVRSRARRAAGGGTGRRPSTPRCCARSRAVRASTVRRSARRTAPPGLGRRERRGCARVRRARVPVRCARARLRGARGAGILVGDPATVTRPRRGPHRATTRAPRCIWRARRSCPWRPGPPGRDDGTAGDPGRPVRERRDSRVGNARSAARRTVLRQRVAGRCMRATPSAQPPVRRRPRPCPSAPRRRPDGSRPATGPRALHVAWPVRGPPAPPRCRPRRRREGGSLRTTGHRRDVVSPRGREPAAIGRGELTFSVGAHGGSVSIDWVLGWPLGGGDTGSGFRLGDS